MSEISKYRIRIHSPSRLYSEHTVQQLQARLLRSASAVPVGFQPAKPHINTIEWEVGYASITCWKEGDCSPPCTGVPPASAFSANNRHRSSFEDCSWPCSSHSNWYLLAHWETFRLISSCWTWFSGGNASCLNTPVSAKTNNFRNEENGTKIITISSRFLDWKLLINIRIPPVWWLNNQQRLPSVAPGFRAPALSWSYWDRRSSTPWSSSDHESWSEPPIGDRWRGMIAGSPPTWYGEMISTSQGNETP